MTRSAKELAERWRKTGNVTDSDIDWMVNRLADIESAVTGEVRVIAERLAGVRALPWASQAEQYLSDIATLLAIIQRGAVALRQTIRDELLDAARAEVERLTALVDAFKAASMLDVGGDPDGVTPRLLERHVTALQNEVERLKEQDKRTVADGLAVLNKLTDARCEIERLKAQRMADEINISSLAKGSQELTAMLAAEKQRADVLAEGVRLLMAKHDGTAPSMQAARAWESEHGHLVGDGK